MSKSVSEKTKSIHAGMTVLDVISKHRQTESVFKQYDQQAGVCICCEALFESIKDVAAKYGLDLEGLLADLESSINLG